jgi:predicted ferric reductase
VAAFLLILLIISGVGQATGKIFKYIEPTKMWIIHRALGISLLISIAIHGGFLLFNPYIRFNLIQLLFPFLNRYSNGTKFLGLPLNGLAVGFGVLSMYIAAILVFTSLGWIEKSPKRWRKLHYLSYVLVVLVFFHGLYVGSDIRYGIFRDGWIFFGMVVVAAIISRLWRSGVTKPHE